MAIVHRGLCRIVPRRKSHGWAMLSANNSINEFKMRRRVIILVLAGCVLVGEVIATEPSPETVANTTSNLWMQADFDGLSLFVTNLYQEYSNYVPAILAASFQDVVFCGRLDDASNKLHRVRDAVAANPGDYSSAFISVLEGWWGDLLGEMAAHESMGTTAAQLGSNAAPVAVRGLSDVLGLDIQILFWAPATNVP